MLKFELLGEVAHELVTSISDYDDVLVPNASHTWPVDAWFNRKYLTGAKRRRRKSGLLVNFKPEPVPGSVKEPAPAAVSDARWIATLGKEGFCFLMNPLALETRPERLKDTLLANKAGFPHVSLRVIGPPANYGAREVSKIAAARIARKDVQDDQLVCRESAFPALVWIAGQFSAGHDRVASRFSSRAHHGEFHFHAEDLCR
jgi:hypothetical protein